MEAAEMTVRALSRATVEHDPRGRGLTHSYLAAVLRGHDWPSYEAVELIAATLAVPLREIAEARLADLRRQLDPKQCGMPAALENLRAVEEALWAHHRLGDPPHTVAQGPRAVGKTAGAARTGRTSSVKPPRAASRAQKSS
jgi:hypothetical protein